MRKYLCSLSFISFDLLTFSLVTRTASHYTLKKHLQKKKKQGQLKCEYQKQIQMQNNSTSQTFHYVDFNLF